MNAVVAILVRLVVISLGFAASCFTAQFALLMTNWSIAGLMGEWAGKGPSWNLLWKPDFAIIIAVYAALPALPVIVLSELRQRRGWPIYVLAGSVFPLPMVVLPLTNARVAWQSTLPFSAAMLVAGAVAGITYWLVAGRSAGLWRRATNDTLPAPIYRRTTPPPAAK